MNFVDTHSHIFEEQLIDTVDKVVERAVASGVTHILLPNIDSSSIEPMLRVEKDFTECRAMMGLHPCYVKGNYKDELDIVTKWHSEREFVGVGEIGIDLYWDKTFVEEQIEAFRYQINLAKELKKPVSIHSRECLDLTIKICEELQDGNLTGVFHCFNGDKDQLQKVADIGMHVGLGGVVTYKNSGMDKVLEGNDLSHAVLETDAPYLSPVPKRGKTNEPSYLVYIAEKMAEITELSLAEVAEKTNANAMSIFKI